MWRLMIGNLVVQRDGELRGNVEIFEVSSLGPIDGGISASLVVD
jgi:hypothetical protein